MRETRMLKCGRILKRFTGLFLIRRAGIMWHMQVCRGKRKRNWGITGLGKISENITIFEYFSELFTQFGKILFKSKVS